MANDHRQLRDGFETAFINGAYSSNLAYRPQFLSNNYERGQKVLSSIEDELLRCEEFYISVAFITKSGITPLLQTFRELSDRGIKGKILTTNYLNFTDPEAMDTLAGLKNIELRMYIADEEAGFHTKGYIFHEGGIYRIIVGSSNMTLSALTRNKEWNTKIVSTDEGEYAESILLEFNELWDSQHTKNYDQFIDSYREAWKISKAQRKAAKEQLEESNVIDYEVYKLKPNKMQNAFIQNMRKLVADGENKALLISATGTGKTYASAFALRDKNPEKILFLVHREQIAKQAMKSYKKVFGKNKTYALLSGNSKQYQADIIFSTMNMMAKDETLEHYSPSEFDTIVVDEVHRAGASSYQKIMSYFKPSLWLGMTASPDRTDGFDIYSLFDHNIAYEIRLQQALEEDLLCPFHYFGITDISINGEAVDDNELDHFNLLTSDERVRHIIDNAEYFGHSGDRVKGLVFCSRKEIGQELSEKFNSRGYRTAFLSGDDSQEKREDTIERLTSDDREDLLDYIFTVDIFNEGVDIPEINQVIMLRPTESPIIFIQQLGRGLRKSDDKDYVVILDFIGNYSNNYMIPIALSGDRSYNKDNMRRFVSDGTRIIPGSSSIHFDEISRKRIYESIDAAKTQTKKLLMESYRDLKFRLGKIPAIKDFAEYGSIDIQKIFDYSGSYHNFLTDNEPDYDVVLSDSESVIIEFLSRKLSKGKRLEDLQILKSLIGTTLRLTVYQTKFSEIWDKISQNKDVQNSVVRVLANKFSKTQEQQKYAPCNFVEESADGLRLTESFSTLLQNQQFAKMVMEILDYGISEYHKNYSKNYKDTNFQLYQKYTYEDVCYLLNWKQNQNAQNLGGYFYDTDTKTLPVFINYEKSEDAIAYEDRFVSPDEIIALSKHPRKVTSSDADHFYKRTEADKDNRIFLFVRKNKDDHEAKEFYFLGEIEAHDAPTPIKMKVVEKNGNIKEDDAFEIQYHLDHPVREDLYEYITG
ncbi:PLD-like domain-containing protein [Lachnospiraceae bacterium]|nr:PLD-like domain-containing protein [Lachnospiraceae bacterium]